jgi:endonuclease YncB( thermonuclease family)
LSAPELVCQPIPPERKPAPRLNRRGIYVSFADVARLVLSTGFAVVPGMAAGSTQTFTGKVSDAMCGAKHMEGGLAPAACVRACVQKGTKYALVVGDKVYALETSDQAALDNLSKLAWEEAKVTGTANGDTISVKSVTAAK